MIILECRERPYYDYGLGGQYCDKVGGRNLLFNYCEDIYPETARQKNHCRQKQKRRNKRKRNQKYRNHLKFLAENISGYPPPVVYTNEVWIKGQGYVDNPKPYYKRLYRNNHKGGSYKFYKKHSNRCVRRYKGEIHSKGNQYKKIFDYWWTVN